MKIKEELLVWLRVVAIFLICISLGMVLIELAIAPGLRWLLYDELYRFPSTPRIVVTALRVVILSVGLGTIIWFARRCIFVR